MSEVKLAVIGGSGVYEMEALTGVEERHIPTPFGDPSDKIVLGTLEGKRIAFLSRHGRGHRLTPTEVPYRANIWALKSLGVERIISLNACGSMRERYEPRHVVIPDQLYDNTKQRDLSFFGEGLVAHIGIAEPFCPQLRGSPEPGHPGRPAARCTWAAPLSSSRALASAPAARATSIAPGASTSSA